jgi:hypothetical protein
MHGEDEKCIQNCNWAQMGDNIRKDVREIWWEGVHWICVAQGRNQWQALVDMGLYFCF